MPVAIASRSSAAALAGLVTGIGVGVFRVHPLIMTLGMSFVVLGLSNVWQLEKLQTGAGVPDSLRTVGSVLLFDLVPYSLIIFVPVALVILLGLRRSGYGRLLYAVGDNPIAARLSGARVLAGPARPVRHLLAARRHRRADRVRPDEHRERLPGRQLRAAVRGGGRPRRDLDPRRTGRLRRIIVGALILTVLTALLTILGFPEPSRQILFGAIIVVVAAAYTRVTAES